MRAPVWLGLEKFLSFEFLRFLAAQLFSPKSTYGEQSQHVINEAIPGLAFIRALGSLLHRIVITAPRATDERCSRAPYRAWPRAGSPCPRADPASAAPPPRYPRRSPHSRRVVTVRKATGDEDKGGSSDDGDIDWKGVVSDSFSEAKRQFMEPLNSPTDYVDMMDAPRKKEKRGEKYKEEYGALDPWSSNAFTTYGFIAVAVLLFVFVVVIGPPPDTNGRCTLPWC